MYRPDGPTSTISLLGFDELILKCFWMPLFLTLYRPGELTVTTGLRGFDEFGLECF